MRSDKLNVSRLCTVVVIGLTLILSLYIMLNRLGLVEGLNFGAGSYYYADIPDFERFTENVSYKTTIPGYVYYLLFFGWGFIMWRLWCFIERH